MNFKFKRFGKKNYSNFKISETIDVLQQHVIKPSKKINQRKKLLLCQQKINFCENPLLEKKKFIEAKNLLSWNAHKKKVYVLESIQGLQKNQIPPCER